MEPISEIQYIEYISAEINRSIKYSEYLAEKLYNSMSYSEYLEKDFKREQTIKNREKIIDELLDGE